MGPKRRRAASAEEAALPSQGWIDVSVPLRAGMVHWPGDPEVQFVRMLDMARGDVCTASRMSLGAHTGTHMDAPLHFVRDGATLETMPLSATVGPARVIEIHDPEAIHAEELRPHGIRRGERVLFKTRNSGRDWARGEFIKDYVYIARDAAEYLAQRRVRTVGVDYLSVGGFERDARETHVALLGAGIWVIEGLDLSKVRPGAYALVCLPLKIVGGDGGPARAILRKERGNGELSEGVRRRRSGADGRKPRASGPR
jgi:arylformamidase